MVFKMLILLGFFAAQGDFIIHSDIHRRIVDRLACAKQKLRRNALGGARFGGFLRAKRAEMRSRNSRFRTD
jgi:hypothetical protein